MREAKGAKIAIRTTDEVKENLRKLTEILSNQMGTRISQTQAVEIAISETLIARVGK